MMAASGIWAVSAPWPACRRAGGADQRHDRRHRSARKGSRSSFADPSAHQRRIHPPRTGTTQIGIDAQKTDGMVKILAEPTVMAISGQKGSFLAGGKIFIPVAQERHRRRAPSRWRKSSSASRSGFLPTVLDGGRINLEVASRCPSSTARASASPRPASAGWRCCPPSRRGAQDDGAADGWPELRDRRPDQEQHHDNIKAFPFLGELPIVGALFRSTEFQTDKSELVFVDHAAPGQAAAGRATRCPPTTTCRRRGPTCIMHGKLEGRPARRRRRAGTGRGRQRTRQRLSGQVQETPS